MQRVHGALSIFWGTKVTASNKKIEELAKRFQANENLSAYELSMLIRNRQGLPEPVQAQLVQETEQQEYYYNRRERRRAQRQKQAE